MSVCNTRGHTHTHTHSLLFSFLSGAGVCAGRGRASHFQITWPGLRRLLITLRVFVLWPRTEKRSVGLPLVLMCGPRGRISLPHFSPSLWVFMAITSGGIFPWSAVRRRQTSARVQTRSSVCCPGFSCAWSHVCLKWWLWEHGCYSMRGILWNGAFFTFIVREKVAIAFLFFIAETSFHSL